MYNVKLPALIDRNTQVCRAGTAGQLTVTISFLFNYAPVCQVRWLGGSVLESVDFTSYRCVFVNGRGARHKLSHSGLVFLGVMCDLSETCLLTQMLQQVTEPVLLSTRYFHEDFLQFSRQPNLCAVHRTLQSTYIFHFGSITRYIKLLTS